MARNVRGGDIFIETAEGSMETYVTAPVGATGSLPLIVFLMDAPGKRPLLHHMADRIAAEGYHVMLPHLYYRVTPGFHLDFASKESFARMSELMRAVGNNMVVRDVEALVAHASNQPGVDTSRVGVVGYCMSGPFALFTASRLADRVRAAASFYGVRLHTDSKDSPHLRLGEISGELYIAPAEHDDYVPLAEIDRFEASMQEAGVRGRVERYWGMHHGFAFTDRPQHDADGERRHWDELLGLFARDLKNP